MKLSELIFSLTELRTLIVSNNQSLDPETGIGSVAYEIRQATEKSYSAAPDAAILERRITLNGLSGGEI